MIPGDLVERLAAVRSIAVVTGAGISAESGIRTYRGVGGLYDDPEAGDRTVEALTGTTLQRDPDRTWRAVALLAREAIDARPNAGHLALVRMEALVDRFVILTQNVDGLHRLAGSQNVIEIHGTITRAECMSCGVITPVERDLYRDLTVAPRCDACGGVLRPRAVLFGELLPVLAAARMQDEVLDRPSDLVIGVGTTGLFPYIVEPILRARAIGSTTVEVNPEETEISDLYDFRLRGPAGEILPGLVRALEDRSEATR
ncbi:MAG: NAD-dependent protein deacylase [Planctomycetes bacterium]|nr:NAD-dependent protein deacylase [Planctomycetota bacterium]